MPRGLGYVIIYCVFIQYLVVCRGERSVRQVSSGIHRDPSGGTGISKRETIMAVKACYMSDRDESRLFASKKEADAYDKMLELAENITAVMEHRFPSLGEEVSEEIGLFIAGEQELFSKAMKGRPDVLAEWLVDNQDKVADMAAHKAAKK